MCLIAFSWQAHPRWRLLLAGNRDEYHARPSAALAGWDAGAGIFGGRDLEAGGTWLGATADGRVCGVTNLRDPRESSHGLSRGLLPVDYLHGDAGAKAHATRLRERAVAYRPFNLLLFDANDGWYLGNRPQVRAGAIAPGLHGLSNADFDTPWPKVSRLLERLGDWLADDHGEDFEGLFAALRDERQAADAALPDTGIGLPLERWLSAPFIVGESYGTRASTVLAIDRQGRGWMSERRYGPLGAFLGEQQLRFGAPD